MTREPDTRAIALVMALRKYGIGDPKVLDAMERTPREMFVEAPFAHQAYENTALPIACGQTISQPFVVAAIAQALELEPSMRVLEAGTGSGYQAAVLAPLCRRVYTIERHRPLLRQAEARFRALGLHNITTRHGDGFLGWPEQAPFDRILLSAAVPAVPPNLIEQLKPGGMLVAPVGGPAETAAPESFSQHLVRIIRGDSGVKQEMLMPVVFVPMVQGLPQEARKPDERSDECTGRKL